jgi:hypothetical protein
VFTYSSAFFVSESEPLSPHSKTTNNQPHKKKRAPKTKKQNQQDDWKGTMMVHSRRRIGFLGHQAMESTNN